MDWVVGSCGVSWVWVSIWLVVEKSVRTHVCAVQEVCVSDMQRACTGSGPNGLPSDMYVVRFSGSLSGSGSGGAMVDGKRVSWIENVSVPRRRAWCVL